MTKEMTIAREGGEEATTEKEIVVAGSAIVIPGEGSTAKEGREATIDEGTTENKGEKSIEEPDDKAKDLLKETPVNSEGNKAEEEERENQDDKEETRMDDAKEIS
jgi:hypothetical protein